MKTPTLTQEQMMEILNKCYEMAANGVANSKSCEELADDYLSKYHSSEIASQKFINAQIAKCTTSGFVTGFGGFATMAVTLPANVVSVIYMQMRMIGTIAVMNGYNLNDDEVQTLVYVCLTGSTVADICKQAGIKATNKFTTAMLKKLPGKVLTKINQKVGFRLVTKFGQKGIVNLVKLVPVAGAAVGGGMDFASTKLIAEQAYKTFALNKLD